MSRGDKQSIPFIRLMIRLLLVLAVAVGIGIFGTSGDSRIEAKEGEQYGEMHLRDLFATGRTDGVVRSADIGDDEGHTGAEAISAPGNTSDTDAVSDGGDTASVNAKSGETDVIGDEGPAEENTGTEGTKPAPGDTLSEGTQTAEGDTGAEGTELTQGEAGTEGTQAAEGDTGTEGTETVEGDTGAEGTETVEGAAGTEGTETVEGAAGAEGTEDAQGDAAAEGGETDGQTGTEDSTGEGKYQSVEEYAKTLLVTSPEYYDEAVVSEAMSIPTADNDARYSFITNKGAKAYKIGAMPEGFTSDSVARRQMTTFDVPVWKLNSDGSRSASVRSITINKKLAASVKCIFSDIFQLDSKFPFNYLLGYSYRKVGGVGLNGSKLMSAHSFGVAIDINAGDYDNDYFLGKGNDLRKKSNPYCITDEVIAVFEKYGWFWGGNFDICSDTMHFQYYELSFLQYDNPEEPFPILEYRKEGMDSNVVRNLQQRLVKLGFLDKIYSSFNSKVRKAVIAFQKEQDLDPDGIVDYETWEPLINLTHDMSYVF